MNGQGIERPSLDQDTVDTRVLLWRKTARERAWDQLGWSRSLVEAKVQSRRTGRGILVLTSTNNPVAPGSFGVAARLRLVFHENPQIMEVVRRAWIPVWVDNGLARPVDRVTRDIKAGLDPAIDGSGDSVRLFLPDRKGSVEFQDLQIGSERLVAELRRWSVAKPSAAVAATNQIAARPPLSVGGSRWHTIVRFLDSGESRWVPLGRQRGNLLPFPTSSDVMLDANATLGLGPREGHAFPGETWSMEPRLAQRLVDAVLPPVLDGPFRPNGNPFVRMQARVVRVERGCTVIWEGEVRCSGKLGGAGGELDFSGHLSGYGVFGADRLPRRFRLASFGARLGEHALGIVISED